MPLILGFHSPAGLVAQYMAVLLAFCGLIASALGCLGVCAVFGSGASGAGTAAILEHRAAKLASIATTAAGFCLLGAGALLRFVIHF